MNQNINKCSLLLLLGRVTQYIIIFTSLISPTWSQPAGSSVTRMLPCLEFLMPCQRYMNDPTPPPSCCTNYLYIQDTNPECLCAIVFSDDLLTYLNVSFDVALTMPDRCNSTKEGADITKCTIFHAPLDEASDRITRLDQTSSSMLYRGDGWHFWMTVGVSFFVALALLFPNVSDSFYFLLS